MEKIIIFHVLENQRDGNMFDVNSIWLIRLLVIILSSFKNKNLIKLFQHTKK